MGRQRSLQLPWRVQWAWSGFHVFHSGKGSPEESRGLPPSWGWIPKVALEAQDKHFPAMCTQASPTALVSMSASEKWVQHEHCGEDGCVNRRSAQVLAGIAGSVCSWIPECTSGDPATSLSAPLAHSSLRDSG